MLGLLLGEGTSCQQLRRVVDAPFIPCLPLKLISNCSSSFLRGQWIAGREGGVPQEAARLPQKDPDEIWEAEETPLTHTHTRLPPFPSKPGRWGGKNFLKILRKTEAHLEAGAFKPWSWSVNGATEKSPWIIRQKSGFDFYLKAYLTV